MRLGIISDIHLEHQSEENIARLLHGINSSIIDKLIIAGDIHSDYEGRMEFLQGIAHDYFYVMGNHDYYGGKWYDDFRDEDGIVGGCLWSNFDNNPIVEVVAARSTPDFENIVDWHVVDSKAVFELHKRQIFESDSKIVVTHFAPSHRSVSPKFQGLISNPYWANNLDNEIFDSDKVLWVHGHVHSKFDYHIGKCRVVCNPLGYPNEIENPYTVKVVEV